MGMELLDNKHVQDIVHQLKRLMSNLTEFHTDCHKLFHGVKLFPIDLDLARTAFQYQSTNPVIQDEVEEVKKILGTFLSFDRLKLTFLFVTIICTKYNLKD